MAKGVKKIKWTGYGKVISDLSVPNKKAVIRADQEVTFEVDQWFNDTTEDEKKRNVKWFLQDYKKRSIVLERNLVPDSPFGLSLPKNLCGPFEYYLEASLFGKRDLIYNTGLIIRGECPPKIISSKWCKTNNGEDVRKEHFFGYGEKIYLNLKTEGLNGHLNLSIDIFRKQPGKNQLVKRYTSVDVIDGEINLEINDSYSWYSALKNKAEIEMLYIQIFDPVNKQYITDYNNDTEHARFLRVKNSIASMEIKPPVNLSPLKTGEPATNYMSYHFCKYTTVKMNEKLLFDESKLVKGQKIGKYIQIQLLAGGSEKDKKIKIELTENTPVKCDNHKGRIFDITDLQKKGIYNPVKISKNAFSFDNNFDYKFKDDYASFFTEYILPVPAAEALVPLATCGYQHILDIKINPDVAWAYHFQYDKPTGGFFKNIDIKIQSGFDAEVLNYARKASELMVKNSFHELPDFMTNYMTDLMTDYLSTKAEKFGFGIHAYRSFDETLSKPAVIMDYTAKYPWIARTLIITCVILSVLVDALILYLTRGKAAGASTTIKVVQKADNYGQKVSIMAKRKGFEFITPKITSFRAQYFEKQPDGRLAFVQTEKVSALPLFGIQYENKHTLGTLVTKFTGIAKVFDYARTAMSIFGKVTLLKKIQDKLKGIPSDENKKPGIVNTNDVNKSIDWLEETIENGAENIFKKFGQELNFILTIKGEYQASYQVIINHLTEAISVQDQLENYVNNSKGIIGRKKGIDAVASCQLKTGYTIKTEWMIRYAPNFIEGVIPEIDKKTEVEGKAEIHGSLFYERQYFYEKPRAYNVDNVLFSGIAGTLSGSVQRGKNDDGEKDRNEIPKTTFVLMEPYVVKGEKTYLFEKETIEKPK